MVQPVQQRTGFPDVAADRSIRPPQPVTVEPQMHLHELRHISDDLVRVAKRPQPLLRHPRPHHLVMVELHTLRGDLAGRVLMR